MRVIPNCDFTWRGLALYLGKRRILTLEEDEDWPRLYRTRYPDGWLSSAANIARAKDAAYGHARYLLAKESPRDAAHSHETTAEVIPYPQAAKPLAPRDVNRREYMRRYMAKRRAAR
jgi:hypothetical protein